MTKLKLFLVVDVAEFEGCLTAYERTLLCARVLVACHQSVAGLEWVYKLVNTSVAPRAFEAALHDACTSSLTGWCNVCQKLPACRPASVLENLPDMTEATTATCDCRGHSPAFHT